MGGITSMPTMRAITLPKASCKSWPTPISCSSTPYPSAYTTTHLKITPIIFERLRELPAAAQTYSSINGSNSFFQQELITALT